MADARVIRAELVKALQRFLDSVVRPVGKLVAELTKIPQGAARKTREPLCIVTRFGDAGLEVGRILSAGVVVERLLKVGKQAGKMAVARIEPVQLGVEVREGAGQQKTQGEWFVEAVAQVELAQNVAQKPPVMIPKTRNLVVGDGIVRLFQETHDS